MKRLLKWIGIKQSQIRTKRFVSGLSKEAKKSISQQMSDFAKEFKSKS